VKLYVITEDLKFLMQRWAVQLDFIMPKRQFFLDIQARLLEYLGTIFSDIIFIPADELGKKLKKKIDQVEGTTIVSIDQIYNSTQYHLESNRIADIDTMEIIGEAQRPGYSSLDVQISQLPGDRPLTIVDDGCFSGETLQRIYGLIQNKGLTVQNIIVGVLIDRANNCLVKAYSDVILEAVYEYDEVIDWVCERDFFIGVPLSGRTAGLQESGGVIPCNPEIALPYCLPFGDPIKGASIPTERAIEFSRFSIELSKTLWKAVENASKKIFLVRIFLDCQKESRKIGSDLLRHCPPYCPSSRRIVLCQGYENNLVSFLNNKKTRQSFR